MKSLSTATITKRLFYQAKSIWKELLISTFASLMGHLGQMGFMVFGALWILSSSRQIHFPSAPWWMIGSGFFIAVGRYAEGIFSHIGAYSILAKLRIDFFEHVARLSPAILVEKEIGDLMNIAIGDIETLEYFYAHTIGPMVTLVVLPLVSLSVASIFSPYWLLLLLPMYLLVIVVLPLIFLKYGKATGLRFRTSLGKLKASILQTVYGLQDLQIFHFQEEWLKKIRRENEEVNQSQHRLTLYRQMLISIPNFLIYLTRILLVYGATYFSGIGKSDPIGTVVVSFLVSASFSSSFSLTFVVTHLVEAYASAERLFSLEDQSTFVVEQKSTLPLNTISDIEFQKVSFQYPQSEKPILTDLNLRIHPGETIGIIGESGCGKSTVLRLLLRFYDVQEGSVRVNGKDIREYSIDSLRKHMSLLEQDSLLLDQSIRDNLLVAKPEADEKELQQALEAAGLADYVQSLAQGLNSPMGEMNGRVSGGERQRLALARAILRNPDVLILDEPSANLDTIHELELLKTIQKAYAHKMVIIISHRYSTLVHCDRIFEMTKEGFTEKNNLLR